MTHLDVFLQQLREHTSGAAQYFSQGNCRGIPCGACPFNHSRLTCSTHVSRICAELHIPYNREFPEVARMHLLRMFYKNCDRNGQLLLFVEDLNA